MAVASERGPQGRFLPFLISLVALFLLYPLMVELDRARWFRLALMVVLAVAVYTMSRKRRDLFVALALGLPSLVAQSVAYWVPGRTSMGVAGALTLLFLGFVTFIMLTHVLRGGSVSADRITGAICVFLLLGLVWTLIYSLVALAQPEAFSGIDPELHPAGGGGEYGFIYFSFVTLTTLGYGDITPTLPLSRTLTWMEAVVGQLYLAILVARLVGLYVSNKGAKGEA